MRNIFQIPPLFLLKLTAKIEYASRVLAQLARTHGQGKVRRIEELGQLEAISPNYLTQILSDLRHAGLVESRRGKGGGYLLARAPEEITLLDVVEATEGQLFESGGDPTGESGKPTREAWQRAFDALADSLRKITLAEIIREEPGAMWHI